MRSAAALALLTLALASCRAPEPVRQVAAAPTPERLRRQCEEEIGAPRIEEVTPNVLVAVGYDLANTILVRTPEGSVVVDAMMSPARAEPARAALLAKAPGPVKAVVYTHSHIDHVGGAAAWTAEGAPDIWATEAFPEHFLKQYSLFLPTERRRGAGQFGRHVPDALVPCSALGRRPDMDAAEASMGIRMPTRTFSGSVAFQVGGVAFELHEAPGETHDQLFVWIPSERALLSGDNLYRAFPNLYTIRGTSPRPVDGWIESLDAMRRLEPEHLVPSHTRPISGAEEVRRVLTDYRDGVQWVRDEVVRRANRGETVDEMAREIGLPEHLAKSPFLSELYGQVDWSVRAIYGNNLGWFDGDPAALYPPPADEASRREIAMMGGREAVLAEARKAREAGDGRWSVHLLAKLRRAAPEDAALREEEAASLEALASGVQNTNGRGYLYESARRLRDPDRDDALKHAPPDEVLRSIPLAQFFSTMAVRLRPADAIDVHESVRFSFPDEEKTFTVTVRRGVAEVVEGEPLPSTPEPVATLTAPGMTWRRLAVQAEGAAGAVLSGDLDVSGSAVGLAAFLNRFERGL